MTQREETVYLIKRGNCFSDRERKLFLRQRKLLLRQREETVEEKYETVYEMEREETVEENNKGNCF